MRGKVTIIGCPKLDAVDYTEKLTEIIANNDIQSVTVRAHGGALLRRSGAGSGPSAARQRQVYPVAGCDVLCGRQNFGLRRIFAEMIKNIEKAQVLTLKEQVAYQAGQVVSKTLAQNDALSVTLFSFDKGEEISTHKSEGDAFVTCLDGVGRITIDGKHYELHEGESIVMPAGHPHAVFGQEQFKMLLVVVF